MSYAEKVQLMTGLVSVMSAIAGYFFFATYYKKVKRAELIQDALFKLMNGKTVIVVAHRLSTVQRLDRILVIEEGKIMEDGNHQELLGKNKLYAEFWEKQTRKFE